MKLTAIAENPALKNANAGKYRYSLKFKGDHKNKKAAEYTSHISLVQALIEGLMQKKLMSEQDINATRAAGSYLLTIEVTDIADDKEIQALLAKSNLKGRYSIKNKIEVDGMKFIICREWTKERVDKLIARTSDVCTVRRLETPDGIDADASDDSTEE
jgi:hypothetical protein